VFKLRFGVAARTKMRNQVIAADLNVRYVSRNLGSSHRSSTLVLNSWHPHSLHRFNARVSHAAIIKLPVLTSLPATNMTSPSPIFLNTTLTKMLGDWKDSQCNRVTMLASVARCELLNSQLWWNSYSGITGVADTGPKRGFQAGGDKGGTTNEACHTLPVSEMGNENASRRTAYL
jgi:hypothetical protein